jgi:hypothetical protein
MRPWFRRSPRAPQPPAARRRLLVEALEDRCLLTTSVLSPLQAPLVRADTTPVGATVSHADTSSPVAQTPNQQYVSQLFLDLLGQSPASDQLSSFSGQLDQGKSRLSVVQQVQALPAYDTHKVQLMYQTLLGTAPTTEQLNQDVKFLHGGGDIGTLRMRVLSSPTFFQREGHGTDAGYVSVLSQDLLHQSAGAATQGRLSQELAAGASRLTVLKDLVHSDLQQVRNAEVQSLYQGYLHRAATAAEVAQQLPLLVKGQGDAIIASLASSDEYFNDAVHANVTTTSVASSPNPSAFGQAVTLTASVVPAAGVGTPTGTVTFTDTTTGTTLGTGTLAGGQATLSVSSLTGGTHVITATYGGDTVFDGSGGSVTQTVSAAATGTSVSGSPDPSTSGQSVTFTAVVRPATSGLGTPTGTVTFTDTTSGTTLGTGTLDGTGQATFATSTLTAGAHTITATYAGDGNFAGSSGTASQTVTGSASATTAVSGSPSPSVFGQSVTFTATVTPATTGGATPTGTVTFTDTTTSTSLGSGPLNSSGQATVSTSALTAGATHTITASYAGDNTYAPGSGTTTQLVNQADTGTSVSGSPSPSTAGQSVTFTATVTATAPGSGTPTGTVTFTDTTSGTTLGTGNLNSSGQATVTATLTTTGTDTINASYGGDENFKGSSGTVNQTVS